MWKSHELFSKFKQLLWDVNHDVVDVHSTIEDLSTKFHELDSSYFSENIENFNF